MRISDEKIRQRVLGEHAILRVLIERLRNAAQGTTEDGFAQELRDAGRTLHFVLEAHTRLEEELLGRRIAGSRGIRSLEELHEHHGRALAALQRLHGRGSEKYAMTALRLVPHLLAAVDLEDRELFSADEEATARTLQKARESVRR
jgi:hypothetical protein